jgi:hypothetical protein
VGDGSSGEREAKGEGGEGLRLPEVPDTPIYSHHRGGSDRGGQQYQQPTLGEEGDFAVHASVYGKVQAEPSVTPNDQERRRERGRCFSLAQAGLSSYLSRPCTMRVSLSGLGGGFHPATVYISRTYIL